MGNFDYSRIVTEKRLNVCNMCYSYKFIMAYYNEKVVVVRKTTKNVAIFWMISLWTELLKMLFVIDFS